MSSQAAYHWDEVELAPWLRKWLDLNITEHVLIDSEELKVRCKETYKDNGECVLTMRKGDVFAIYNMDLIIKWNAQKKLNDRVVGEAKGRFRVLHFSSTDEEMELCCEGEWQYKRPLGSGPIKDIMDEKTWDAVSDGEKQLKDLVKEKALPLMEKRLQRLKLDLAALKSRQLPEPAKLSEEYGPRPATLAEATTKDLLHSMKAKLRPLTFDVRIDDIKKKWAKAADFRCMCLTDADVPAIVDALLHPVPDPPGTYLLTSQDLSYNDISDAGFQALLLALATGAAPDLTFLRLDHTKLSDLGKRQFNALKTLRKGLSISMESSEDLKLRLQSSSSAVSAASE